MPRPLTCRAAALCAALLLAPATALAGDWHGMSNANCSDCHTMHNSENGQPMRYDHVDAPAPGLLRGANAVGLCISCHDGSNASAPDVMGPVSYVADPAGGAFQAGPGVDAPTGHSLAAPAKVPPGGTTPMTLTCTTCHAAHGTPAFRNLVANPSGSGAAGVSPVVKQTTTANGSNPAAVYVTSNLVYKSGMSQWCGDCHGMFHGKTADHEGTASPWLRHPQDQTIFTSRNVDAAFWRGAVPNRIRVQSPSDDVVPSNDDQVFCLSCHKAHGSANKASLIFADGATKLSTCQQCHDE